MKSFFLLLIALGCIGFTRTYLHSIRDSPPIFQAPPKSIVNYTFGYQDLLGTLLWVHLLQDINICDQGKANLQKRQNRDSKLDPIKSILAQDLGTSKCELGWVYKMSDVVTELQPQFYGAYYISGLFLSVIVDDRVGAGKIFEKGLLYFPTDWRLLYAAAYNSFFELKEPKKAADLLVRAGRWGAPAWVYSLAGGLYNEVGQARFAKPILEAAARKLPEGHDLDRIRRRLERLNKVLQEPVEESVKGSQ